MLAEALKKSRVDISLAPVTARPTTLAFVRLVDGQATYAFFDENSAGRMLAPADEPVLPADVTALHFGAISLVQEPGATVLEEMLLREHGTRVISLDPNVRPGLIRERPAYEARMQRLVAASDVVKLSEDDLRWFAPTASIDDFARDWLSLGPAVVIVTRGGDGAVAYSGRDRVEVPAVPVKIADTVGAGDTFTAGALAALSNLGLLEKASLRALTADQLRAVLSYAARVAGVTVSRPGADPPWAEEL
jgi:fructokinase